MLAIGNISQSASRSTVARRVDPELFGKTYDDVKVLASSAGGNKNPLGLGGKSGKNLDDCHSYDYKNDNLSQKTIGTIGGTSADYLTARIARDRPDILAKMNAEEFLFPK